MDSTHHSQNENDGTQAEIEGILHSLATPEAFYQFHDAIESTYPKNNQSYAYQAALREAVVTAIEEENADMAWVFLKHVNLEAYSRTKKHFGEHAAKIGQLFLKEDKLYKSKEIVRFYSKHFDEWDSELNKALMNDLAVKNKDHYLKNAKSFRQVLKAYSENANAFGSLQIAIDQNKVSKLIL